MDKTEMDAATMGERDWPTELDLVMGAVDEAQDVYSAALAVTACAVEWLVESVVASRLYQIWAALQDRYELKPAERREAIDAMQRAAREWGAASDDGPKRAAYLDHWQYDVAGYARPD